MSELYAGVDLGGTNVTCALADARGRMVATRKGPTRSAEGATAVLERIAAMVKELTAEAGRAPAAVGMGIPGLVDRKRGVTKFLPNFPTNWPDVPVGRVLGERLGCAVHILNDARTATLGELTFGKGKGGRERGLSMVFFGIGTGVGGGVVIDGRLRLGPLGAAGELGHHTMLPDGPLCGCGNRGCLETLAAGPAITAEGIRLMLSGMAPRLHERVGGDVAKVTTREMAAAAEAGDASVRGAIEQAARWLGYGVANVVVTLHPELIVLGGGVAEIGPMYIDTVERTMRGAIGMFPTDGVRVEKSALGVQAGILGAVALAAAGGDV
ncbi:MAG: ROK family protein [Planctomycetes bacterium]|nr:ROK family protein [Planctomycetota bacterium]